MNTQTKLALFFLFADDSDNKDLDDWRPFGSPTDTKTMAEIARDIKEMCGAIRVNHPYGLTFGYNDGGISVLRSGTEKHWDKVSGLVVDLRLRGAEETALLDDLWTYVGAEAPDLFTRREIRMLACLLPASDPIPTPIASRMGRKDNIFRFELVPSSREMEERIAGWLTDISEVARRVLEGRNVRLRKMVKEYFDRLLTD